MKLSYGEPSAISSSSDLTRGPIDADPRGEAARVENDDPAVGATLAAEPRIELEEVVAVVRHDRSLSRLRVLEEVLVNESSEFSTLTDRLHVTPADP
jgi:hypothetical protein